MYTRIKTEAEIENIRISGSILAATHRLLRTKVEPGISTKELADITAKEIKSLGGEPAFLGYGAPTPFPDVICISVNEEVVHGIPKKTKILKDGDIVSLDLGVTYGGMITDASITVGVGKVADKNLELMAHTKKSLDAAIAAVKHGCQVGDISAAVQKYLERYGYGIVRDLVGHGVGHEVHEDPNIPNYGRKGTGPKLVAGMTIAVEPMATLGNYGVHIAEDGWTIVTNDGSYSAQFEHTLLITNSGCEVLTI